jgi:hypothetical protein
MGARVCPNTPRVPSLRTPPPSTALRTAPVVAPVSALSLPLMCDRMSVELCSIDPDASS